MTFTSRDSVLGCIIGGAIGDAYGGPYEGKSPPVKIDVNRPWRLSDDTQLTLAMCEAIAQSGNVDPEGIADQFRQWFISERVSGLGASTFKVLSELAHGGHWALVGRKGEMAAGNGAAMRIAPLAFLLDPADAQDRKTIRDVCRITHHNEEAYVGALAILAGIRMAVTERWSGESELSRCLIELLPDSRVRDRLIEIDRIGPEASLADVAKRFGNSGYVVESVPLAICGAARVDSLGFQAMIEQLIATGGDTDTIASMAGQLAGARIGYDRLPDSLVSQVPDMDVILPICDEFCAIL